MNRLLFPSLLGIALCLPSVAPAADRVALVIGIDDYENLPPQAQLQVAVRDAKSMADTLESLEPAFQVTLLKNAIRIEAGKAIDNFIDSARDAECALVYFAGHGIEYNGENFLLNRDTNISVISADVERMKRRLRTETVSLQSLVDDLDATRAQVKVVILDACRDNPLRAEGSDGTRSAVVGSKGGLASVTPPSGSLISYSADAGQQANDGLFTAVLTRNLKTPGKTIMEVFADTRSEVLRTSTKLADDKRGVRHEPAEYVKLNSAGIHFSFLPGKKEAVPDTAALLADMKAKLEEVQRRNQELEKAMANRNTSDAEIERLKEELEEANREAEDTMKKTGPEPMAVTQPEQKPTFPATRGMEGSKAGETRSFGGIEFVWCPPTSEEGFLMGSPEDEEDRDDDEKQHRVILTKGFWMAKTECTQGQWESVIGSNPSKFTGSKNLPVEKVSWDDVQGWLAEMNETHPLPEGWKWVLPTEAQWEYACRAGTETAYNFGDDGSQLHRYGNFADKNVAYDWADKSQDDGVGEKTAEVGSYEANAWGLFDMHGNVWEWCADWYGEDYYDDGQRDPTGAASGSYRVIRGGSWGIYGLGCRSAHRYGNLPDYRYDFLGFRPAVRSTR